MVEIYNEQVRDLLSSDGPQKRYPLIFFPYGFPFSFFGISFIVISFSI